MGRAFTAWAGKGVAPRTRNRSRQQGQKAPVVALNLVYRNGQVPSVCTGSYITLKLGEPALPSGLHSAPLTMQPKVLAPVCVAGGNWLVGTGTLLWHLLPCTSTAKHKYRNRLRFIGAAFTV